MGRRRRFREGFKRLTPRREYIYKWDAGFISDGYYGGKPFENLKDYKRRKWSRIRKVRHRVKKLKEDEEDEVQSRR